MKPVLVHIAKVEKYYNVGKARSGLFTLDKFLSPLFFLFNLVQTEVVTEPEQFFVSNLDRDYDEGKSSQDTIINYITDFEQGTLSKKNNKVAGWKYLACS